MTSISPTFSDWKLGLTGTITKEFRIFLTLVGIPVVAEVTRKEAEFNKWIAPLREYNLPVYLNEKESIVIKLLYHFVSTRYFDFKRNKKVKNVYFY